MARKDNLTKSKSIYTIRKKDSDTAKGAIFETDYYTILPNDGIYDEGEAIFTDSNFKFKIRKGTDEKKRHVRSSWVPVDAENSDNNVWTRENLSNSNSQPSSETKIELKPNYASIQDFAYFGSAVELIKATINDVVLRFPGGLGYYSGALARVLTIDGVEYCIVSNEFSIDCWTMGPIAEDSVENPMRVLSASYANYVDAEGKQCEEPEIVLNGSNCPDSIIGTVTINGNEFIIYNDSTGAKVLCYPKTDTARSGFIIRPKQEIIDAYWDTLDDFEKVLLNRDTDPVYKATFESPYLSEDGGYFFDNKSFIWPTVGDDGFTPDISTGAFQGYLSALLSVANYYDENESDNIWRMLTHESIKNLDRTNLGMDSDGDETAFDSTRIQAMLRVYGRQFDDLKRAAEGIKSSNSISYDEKNNLPNYFLTDSIENDGWGAQNIAPIGEDVTVTAQETYGNENGINSEFEYTPSDANIAFDRRLSLSSNYIQSLKGTRRGIKAILNMFGYEEDADNKDKVGTYCIDEHVAIANTFPKYEETSRLRAKSGEYLYFNDNDNFMVGYPVAKVSYDDNSDNDYLIPWYSKNEKYDYPIYFQEKGGWGRRSSKKINLPITLFTKISEMGDTPIYGETEPYMKYAKTLDEMTSMPTSRLRPNTVCYVSDISDLYKDGGYKASPEDLRLYGTEGYSHYFILKNVGLSTKVGFVDSSDSDIYTCYGWRNVYSIEFNGESADSTMTDDGMRVLYLESLSANYKGNNPHIGRGDYDDGMTYIEKYNQLFAEAASDGVYDELRAESKDEYNELLSVGFGISALTVDNKKCHYFSDTEVDGAAARAHLEPIGTADEDEDTSKWDEIYGSLVNPEGNGEKCDEAAAFSMINIKNITINFGIGANEYLKDYIERVVLKYLEEMIPSTAILRYTFDGEEDFIGSISDFSSTDYSVAKEIFGDIAAEGNKDKVWAENEIDGNTLGIIE